MTSIQKKNIPYQEIDLRESCTQMTQQAKYTVKLIMNISE